MAWEPNLPLLPSSTVNTNTQRKPLLLQLLLYFLQRYGQYGISPLSHKARQVVQSSFSCNDHRQEYIYSSIGQGNICYKHFCF